MPQAELDPRNHEAIQAALEGAWQRASEINIILAEEYPEDVDVLNRLAKAHTELGQLNKARSAYEKVLALDPYNPIAERNLDSLAALRGNPKSKEINSQPIDPDIFLEEPGKTKTIEVVDLAMQKVLVTLRVGNPITLNANKNDVTVISKDNQRLGKLDSTWGSEIAQAIDLGSSFTAVVKSIQVSKNEKNNSLSVFLRETKRSKKLANPIFPIDTNFTPYVRENTLPYFKNEESLLTETSEETEPVEVEELPSDETEDMDENTASSKPNPIEDEEDFSTM